MSKYAEAIARKIDEENYYHDCMISYLDNESVSEHYKGMMEKASLELKALQIAERLEQISKLGVVCKPHKYGSKTEAFTEGYKQALSDVRGDNNG